MMNIPLQYVFATWKPTHIAHRLRGITTIIADSGQAGPHPPTCLGVQVTRAVHRLSARFSKL